MKKLTIDILQEMVSSLRAIHETENALLKLQETLRVCKDEVGEDILGSLPLMELVPVVRFNESTERLLLAIVRVANEELEL